MDDLIVQGGIPSLDSGKISPFSRGVFVPSPLGFTPQPANGSRWAGKLVLPGFVESHIHPDKAFVADRAPGLQAGGPTPQVLLAELKKAFTVDDVYQRARRALRYAVRHGCTAMRVPCGSRRLRGLRA